MEYMQELKQKLCRELEEIAMKSSKASMSPSDIEEIHMLTDTIKNIDKIDRLEEGYSEMYSRDGDWQARGSYNRGSSYANRGQHYVRGHYSRENRDARGRYSRDDAKGEMMGAMEDLMDSATTEKERDIIRRAMEQLEKA